jgi:NAD(P)-dependent dehydrogenase (short-subunit alcohol dehydrogenase family)
MADLLRLDGKTAFVTGASGGIGAHFAEVLAGAGAKVIIAARREAQMAEVAAKIRAAGGICETVTLDVSSSASIAAVEPLFAEVDILVNNAGIVIMKGFLDQTEADWDAVVDTNLKGMFLLTQAAARAMKARGKGGSIINISSIFGVCQERGVSPYATSKAAVIQLTKTSGLELAAFGIRVNAICPGYTATEMNRELWSSDIGKVIAARIPMGRFGQPSDMSGPLLLLASDASHFMTGAVIVVDGGHVLTGP